MIYVYVCDECMIGPCTVITSLPTLDLDCLMEPSHPNIRPDAIWHKEVRKDE
jgi:hypothetical protein